MNARHFVTEIVANEFVITEVVKNDAFSPGISRKLAWQQARSQANPVVFVSLGGLRRELGDCWDRETWETAMYTGHISYQMSMTDGYYGPEDKTAWVAELRRFPNTAENDANDATKAALARWVG